MGHLICPANSAHADLCAMFFVIFRLHAGSGMRALKPMQSQFKLLCTIASTAKRNREWRLNYTAMIRKRRKDPFRVPISNS